MKKALLPLMFVALTLGAGTTRAQQTTPLCTPPLPPDCVFPQWGATQPDDTVGVTGGAMIAAAGSRHVRLVRVKTEPMPRNPPPKMLVDDGKRYASETGGLIAAIRRARFDKEGTLVSGGDAIRERTRVLRAASPNHHLNLYVRGAAKQSDRDRRLLGRKVAQLNDLLDDATSTR